MATKPPRGGYYHPIKEIVRVVIALAAPLILGLVLAKTEPRVARWAGVWLLTAGVVMALGGLYFFAAPTNGGLCRQELTLQGVSEPTVCPPEVQPELARRVDATIQSQTRGTWVLIAIGVSTTAVAIALLAVTHQRLRSNSKVGVPEPTDAGSGTASGTLP